MPGGIEALSDMTDTALPALLNGIMWCLSNLEVQCVYILETVLVFPRVKNMCKYLMISVYSVL